MKKVWKIVHDADDENGNPTCWTREVNHPKYGRFVWISETDTGYDITVYKNSFIVLKNCMSLPSAKRWVSINLNIL